MLLYLPVRETTAGPGPVFRHGRENLLWHRKITNAFLLPRVYQLLVSLWQTNVSVPSIDTSGSGRQRKKNHPEVCAPKAVLSNLRPFPRGLGCFLFSGTVHCIYRHLQKVSGTLEVNASPAQKVKQKGVALKLEANLWDLEG